MHNSIFISDRLGSDKHTCTYTCMTYMYDIMKANDYHSLITTTLVAVALVHSPSVHMEKNVEERNIWLIR